MLCNVKFEKIKSSADIKTSLFSKHNKREVTKFCMKSRINITKFNFKIKYLKFCIRFRL